MFNKKTITAILSIAMAAASFTGCSSDNKSSGNDNTKATVLSPDASKSYNVVCTIFPEYDWVKIKELDCDTVFTLENSNKDIANAIISNSGKKDVKIAELNSLQSVSKSDISSGASYISLMQKNYDVLAGVMK